MNLEFIVCCDTKLRYIWEVAVQLNNARQLGISDKFTILLFTAKNRNPHPNVQMIENKFPETTFIHYKDDHDIFLDINHFNYPSLNRLYMLRRYFKTRENKPFFYLDSDVIFQSTEFLNSLLQDDINYLSDTSSYLSSEYFDSKIDTKFIREDKFQEFKRRDILQECAELIGISRKTIVDNDKNCGGAQYLLKNIESRFWGKCYIDTCSIRQFLRRINQEYMKGDTPKEKEDNGYQSWCADMWAILWNLYKLNVPVSTPKSMDFAWATNTIDRLSTTNLMHNAGVTSDQVIRTTQKDENKNSIFVDAPAFYKGKDEYVRQLKTPFEDVEYLNNIITHPISKTYCTAYYAEAILSTKQNLNL